MKTKPVDKPPMLHSTTSGSFAETSMQKSPSKQSFIIASNNTRFCSCSRFLKVVLVTWGLLCALAPWVVSQQTNQPPKPMNQDPILTADVFLGKGKMGCHTMRIPAIVVTTKGTLLAFAEGRVNSESDYGKINLLMRRSMDNGRSWGPVQVVYSEEGGAPCPIVDRESGKVWLLFCPNARRLFLSSSSDDGVTFATPIEITKAAQEFAFPWSRIASGPVHGIQCRDGLLVAQMFLHDEKKNDYRSAVMTSGDGGVTWHVGGVVGPEVPNTNEGTVVELADGSLYLNMRAEGASYRAVSRSTDRGRTWSAPVLDKNLPAPTISCSTLKVKGPGGEDLILFSNLGLPGAGLNVKLSRDGGKTWSVAKRLPGLCGYSDLAQGNDGTIHIMFETIHSDPGHWREIRLTSYPLEALVSAASR